MIIDLSDYGKFLAVSAFKAPQQKDPTALLRAVRENLPSAEVQFFDCAYIAGTEHLEIAAINALHAFRNGINISRSLSMETLLYASAQRQIDAAIRMLGVSRGSERVGFVAFSETKEGAELFKNRISQLVGTDLDATLLDEWFSGKADMITETYGIEKVELEALSLRGQEVREAITKAVVERVALLSTRT